MKPEYSDSVRQLELRVKQLEEDLAASQQRLAATEDSCAQWLRVVSHDLRGPLTLVIGHVQNAIEHLPADEGHAPQRRDLEAAVRAAQRLDKMVGQVVDAARLEANLLTLNLDEVEVAPILHEQIRQARRRYQARTIRSSIPPDLPPVHTDGHRVGQIVASLLSNAILFSAANSPVSLSACLVGETMRVSVSDHGIGLTEAEQRHLFEKFYRHERAHDVRREGLGLSLRVAACLAERLDGQLWVESPGANAGCTFHLNLPTRATE